MVVKCLGYMAVFLITFFNSVFSQGFITLEEFGVKANGADETERILHAIKHAKEDRLGIRLQNNKTYKFSPTETVDITGIPSITGNGTIDASGAGPNAGRERMNYLFTVAGKKSLVQANVRNIKHGEKTVALNSGLKLSEGDIVFITSVEPLPNDKRKYNRKGQRAVVKSYDGGKLTITDSFYFTIINATIWKIDEQPAFEVTSGVHFITSPMNFMSCIQLIYAKAKISGHYENFVLAGIYFRSSEGAVENATIELPVKKNNGYSYGVAVSDMSDVTIKNCTINGGRHTICATSGGLWTADESGGSGKEKLGYPATVTVDGGVYKTTYDLNAEINEHLGTIDSHGSVYKAVIRNCTVYGGISLGAAYAEVDNVTIFTNEKRAFNIGSDVLPGSDWGSYKISQVTVNIDNKVSKSVLFGKADINQVLLDQVTIKGANSNTVIADFKDYAPKKLIIRAMDISPRQSDPKIWINDKTDLVVESSSFDKNAVKLLKR